MGTFTSASSLQRLHVSCPLDLKKMRYVAAYMLAALGGNEDISAADIEKILSSVGIEAESDKLEKVISELKGKNLATLIAEGHSKLASMPAGGAAPEAAKEEKEEKKKESESESDDDCMGFGLFDDYTFTFLFLTCSKVRNTSVIVTPMKK